MPHPAGSVVRGIDRASSGPAKHTIGARTSVTKQRQDAFSLPSTPSAAIENSAGSAVPTSCAFLTKSRATVWIAPSGTPWVGFEFIDNETQSGGGRNRRQMPARCPFFVEGCKRESSCSTGAPRSTLKRPPSRHTS